MGRYVSNRSAAEQLIGEQLRKYLEGIGAQYERILQGKFRESKSGRIYGSSAAVKAYARYRAGQRKSRPGRVHQASAPGEAPAIWSAFLAKGIRYFVAKMDDKTWSLVIGVTEQSGRSKIASMLEFGTSRMRPRPAWRPALAEWKAQIAK